MAKRLFKTGDLVEVFRYRAKSQMTFPIGTIGRISMVTAGAPHYLVELVWGDPDLSFNTAWHYEEELRSAINYGVSDVDNPIEIDIKKIPEIDPEEGTNPVKFFDSLGYMRQMEVLKSASYKLAEVEYREMVALEDGLPSAFYEILLETLNNYLKGDRK